MACVGLCWPEWTLSDCLCRALRTRATLPRHLFVRSSFSVCSSVPVSGGNGLCFPYDVKGHHPTSAKPAQLRQRLITPKPPNRPSVEFGDFGPKVLADGQETVRGGHKLVSAFIALPHPLNVKRTPPSLAVNTTPPKRTRSSTTFCRDAHIFRLSSRLAFLIFSTFLVYFRIINQTGTDRPTDRPTDCFVHPTHASSSVLSDKSATDITLLDER